MTISDLDDVHKALTDMVRLVSHTARTAGVDVGLAYGTALGAVRDGGIIPWDTDADVYVRYCELPRLIEALKAELADSDFQVLAPPMKGFDHLFPRVAPKGVDHNLVHLDIFPVVGTFASQSLGFVHLKLAKLIRLAYLMKYTDIAWRYSHDARKRRVARLLQSILLLVPGNALRSTFHVLATLRSQGVGSMSVNIGGSYTRRREVMPTSWLFPLKSVRFGDITAFGPADTHRYLTQLYGDYGRPPSDDVRRAAIEFFRSVTLPKILARQGHPN